MDVELDDGTIIEGVPEGTTKAQIMARVQKMNAPAPSALTPQKTSFLDKAESVNQTLGTLRKFSSPIGLGVEMTGRAMNNMNDLLERGAYTAGGAVTDKLAGKVSPEVAGAAGYLTNVGVQAIPTVLGAVAGEAVKNKSQIIAKDVIQSALKPSSAATAKGSSAIAIQTILDEGVNITPAGAQTLRSKINSLNGEIMQHIKNSPEMVDRNRVSAEIYKTLQKFRQQVNPGADVEAIRKSWAEFNNLVAERIPVQQAQALKQGTYRVLGERSFGELKAAETEAQKALARGLRAGIEERIPEVAKLNQKEANLIKTLDLMEHRIGLSGNKDIGGLAWLANDPKAAAAFFAGRSELFKSIVGRMLYQGARATPVAGAAAGAAIGYDTQGQQ